MQMTMCTATADDSHITDETTINSLTSVAAANIRLNSVFSQTSSALVHYVELRFCTAAACTQQTTVSDIQST